MGLSTEAKVLRVIDGDTIEVEVTRRFPIRIAHKNDQGLYYDAPNKATPAGKRTITEMEKYVGQDILLFVPTHGQGLIDFTSFNRVIGQLWKLDGTSITQELLDSGFANLVKKDQCQ